MMSAGRWMEIDSGFIHAFQLKGHDDQLRTCCSARIGKFS
jgi:hypothetical protein